MRLSFSLILSVFFFPAGVGLFAEDGVLPKEESIHVSPASWVVVRDESVDVGLPEREDEGGVLLELTAEGLYRLEEGEVLWRGRYDGRILDIARFEEERDRAFSAFLFLNEEGEAVGAPVWATGFPSPAERRFTFPQPSTKKGLNSLVMLDDAVELGVGHVVENISIGGVLDLDDPDPELYQVVDGQRIGFNAAAVRRLDERLRGFRDAGMDATGILLNWKGSARHESLVPSRSAVDGQNVNIFAFNLETPEGIRIYRAVVEFLAERYTRPDGRYGWLSGLVIGNEIQSHWVWYNLGEADAETVLGDYLLALRIADIAGRSRHPDFRVFASMTHHWTARGAGDPKRGLSGVEMLNFLNEKGKAGGDFPWGAAFHPYPENLFRPDFWNDRSAHLSMDSPRVTMKNIEVLDAFMARPEMRHEGEVREIILSEQGFHGPLDEAGERLQAAALAYAFEKVGRMPSIRAFHLHRHVDHPHEGGLLLGLWSHGGSAVTPERKKKAWEVFRAFGTEEWERVSEPFLEVTGLSGWEETMPARREEIPQEREIELAEGVVADLFHLMEEAEVSDALDFRGDGFLKSAGWLADSIMHHPPNEGSSQALFRLTVPEREEDLDAVFSFGSGLAAASVTGVIFRVYVNDDLVFEHHHVDEVYTPHEVELYEWAGQDIAMVLEVDSNGPNTHDWAHWVEPRITMR